MILLLGTLYDVDMDINVVSVDMEKYHTLARAAMAMYPINHNPSIPGIRALVRMRHPPVFNVFIANRFS